MKGVMWVILGLLLLILIIGAAALAGCCMAMTPAKGRFDR